MTAVTPLERYAHAAALVNALVVRKATGRPDVRARIDTLGPADARDALEAAVGMLALIARRDAAQPEETDAG